METKISAKEMCKVLGIEKQKEVHDIKECVHKEKIDHKESELMRKVDQALDEYLEETKKECETYGDLEKKVKELEWKGTWSGLSPYALAIARILKEKIEEEKKGLKIKK
jgi:hypothetical protein